jgi:predicted ribosome quality control (RQC) complex YloA/Tae2 family protein
MNWQEISKAISKNRRGLAGLIKEVKPEKNSVVIDLGIEVEIDISKSIHENADVCYENAKKARDKLEGVLKAIEKTKKEMNRVEELLEKKFVSTLRVSRKREWYEHYRWFITSDGFLVIGGRTAEMNEEVVSKHLESRDLFFHTQSPGAPATILKMGQEAPESSIKEAAIFAASYSALWKEGKHSGEVYYVKPEQVSRAAKAGEYLPKGSFYIKGKRSYLTVELECAIGVDLSKLRVIGGPRSAVEKHADYFVELTIGGKDANELSVEIAKKLAEISGENRHVVKAIATPDEIMKFLPPGKSRIKS